MMSTSLLEAMPLADPTLSPTSNLSTAPPSLPLPSVLINLIWPLDPRVNPFHPYTRPRQLLRHEYTAQAVVLLDAA